MPPRRYACSASRTPYLQTCMTLCRYTYSALPASHNSMPPRLHTRQRASRAPSLRVYARAALCPSIPPELGTSTSIRLQCASRGTGVPASVSPHLYVTTPATRLQTSMPPRLHACNATLELQSFISPRRYTYGAPVNAIHISTSLNLFEPPGLHASTLPRR